MSKQTYPSRISWPLVLFLVGLLGTCMAIMILSKAWIGLAIMLVCTLFILGFYIRTAYVIDPVGQLEVLCGLYYRQRIDIQKIKSIRKSSSPLSAPALSLDRLEIRYNERDFVLISPNRQEEFIQQLLAINPGIKTGV
jgi:hypothetical protein